MMFPFRMANRMRDEAKRQQRIAAASAMASLSRAYNSGLGGYWKSLYSTDKRTDKPRLRYVWPPTLMRAA